MGNEIPETSSLSEKGIELAPAAATQVDEVYTPEQQAADAERYRVTQGANIVESANTVESIPFEIAIDTFDSGDEIAPTEDKLLDIPEKVAFEYPDLDPEVQAVERSVLERTNRDISQMQSGTWGRDTLQRSSGTGFTEEWRKSNDRITMQEWDSFVQNNPEKAKLYRANHADIDAAIQRLDRRQAKQRQEEDLRQKMETLQREIDTAAAGFGEYLNKTNNTSESASRPDFEQITTVSESGIVNVQVDTRTESAAADYQTENDTPFESNSRTTYAGRLIEYITGVKIDDPLLPERLKNDQNAIRAKYKLPPREMRLEQPGEYEKVLLEIARKYKIQIATKSECGSFFEESPMAGGVFFDQTKKVGVDLDKTSKKTYTKSLGTLEHELIHGMQNEYSPRMPIEQMEYEAYIAGANLEHLKDMEETDRDESLKAFIGFSIGGSVQHWYSNLSKMTDKEQRPTWDDPEYFVK
jgi:hypothetical protein